jgi:hypothetical protein
MCIRAKFLSSSLPTTAALGVRREKAAQGPPGDSLQLEAIGAVMEVTKWPKPCCFLLR